MTSVGPIVVVRVIDFAAVLLLLVRAWLTAHVLDMVAIVI